ncbi:MAG: Rrf2 family transcriptional regulator, partial [Clostridia bacterium]|nr:Rrf2 family transcriptional regulator [Clostridia bacterium]
MRITNEADYALRFILVLSDGSQKSAKIISEETGVTLRFALKILRKLSLAEIVGSQQGATGGYFLKRSA